MRMRGLWLAIGTLAAIACSGATIAGSADGGASAGTGGASAGTGGARAGTGGASAGTGGDPGDGGTGGIDCVALDYCDGDTLMVLDHEQPPCDPQPILCPNGCVDAAGGGAVCALLCSGMLCPVPPDMGYFGQVPCCTQEGRCGFANYQYAECYPFDWPGVVDTDCPTQKAYEIGCCLPGNACGVMGGMGCEGNIVPDAGCSYPGGADAGTDATPDAAPADATPD